MEPTQITIQTTIAASPAKVWECWTKPEHIVNWNFASGDWHCPQAKNELRAGGKYYARMEAKDGSMGFDFEAIYDQIEELKTIAYSMSDGRKAVTNFEPFDNNTRISTTFDAESSNPVDLQRQGWQAILNNFKKYVESNR
jgi:uncharacterized protein YndB with AHSA1/START domain